uniref:Uncharacterized protein n=1 Tax=Avena sativa TaxID=4498 RepID=A0ACD5XGU1_AVESA
MVSILPDQDFPSALVVTEDLILEELRAVLPGHEWPVHQVSTSEFAVHFPSVEILRMCACGSSFTLPLHQLRVSIQPSSAAQETVATLSEVWVRISGIPHEARRPEVVALLSQAVGKLTEVDMSSLPGHGPIRLRLLCPAISVFLVSLPRVFFDRVGRDLLVELDEEDGGAGGPVALLRAAALPGASPRLPVCPRLSLSAPAKLAPVDVPRCFRSDPLLSIDLPITQYYSNLGADMGLISGVPHATLLSSREETSGSVGLVVCSPQSPRSPGVVCYSLAPDTPNSASAAAGEVAPRSPEVALKLHRHKTPRPPPPLPSRHSVRLAGARVGLSGPETTVAERAAIRVAARDEISGEVADDCGIVFRGEKGPRVEQLAAIKAREGYAGAIAAARARDARERERAQILAVAGSSGPGPSKDPPPAPDEREVPLETTPRGRRSAEFLLKLKLKVEWAEIPVVVAGDFNLIRAAEDKSSANVDLHRMQARIRGGSSGQVAAGGRLSPRAHFAVDIWHHCTKISRQFMRGWGANLGAELRSQKESILREIQALDREADLRGLSAEAWSHRYALETSIMEIYRGEEAFWRQRSRQNWTVQGKWNTAYFHAIANGRRRKCSIPCLWEGGALLESPQALSSHIYSFYKSLFSTMAPSGISLAPAFWTGGALVTPSENADLTRPFLADEVSAALKSMKTGSAPGPDGLSVSFLQTFWDQLQPVIMRMFQEFYIGTLVMAHLNFGVITLIPKVVGATDIRQFHPITVINVIQRLFAKVCAIRLAPVLERLTHPLQFAFLKGCLIHDDVLALHEIIHEVKARHQKGVFLKLDFQKAYNRLDWAFLRLVLERRGFDDCMICWSMQFVMSGRTAININGEIGPYFTPSCGVRQGDPISPLLFNSAVDALAEILDRAKIAGHITGVVGHLIPGGGISHLQYADDTMIMVQGSDLDIKNLKFLLLCFEAMSGLKINFDKSEVMVLGFDDVDWQRIADNLNCNLAEPW